MGRRFQLGEQSFEALLSWLDFDREKAGQKYENIRRSLIHIFRGRKCSHPEDLADEAINRVVQKLPVLGERFQGEPSTYFFSVAQMIYLEDNRRQAKNVALDETISYEHDFDANLKDPRRVCLKDCLAAQPADDRKIVTAYYVEDEKTKIKSRSQLAEDMSVTISVLRVRAFRIRQRLFHCVEGCLKKKFKTA